MKIVNRRVKQKFGWIRCSDALILFFYQKLERRVKMKAKQDFTQGSILMKLLQFAIPILFANLLQAFYTAADLMIVGQFSNTSQVSAVSTGGQVMQTLTSLVSSLSIGITILVGQVLGKKDKSKANQIITNAIFLFLGLAVILMLVVIMFAPQLAHLMHAPKSAFNPTVMYLKISGAGALFIVGYNLVGATFRGLGDSITPLITVAIAAVINVFLDLLLVAHFHLGANGAALATIAAQALSLVAFYFLSKKKGQRNIELPAKSQVDFGIIKNILQLGSPIALQDFLINMSFVIILAIANSMGVTASAGIGVGEKTTGFIMLIPIAFMQAMAAFVAQNVGAKQHHRAKQSLFYGLIASLSFAMVMSYVCFFHGDKLAQIFTQNHAVIEATSLYMKSYAFDVLLTAIFFSFVGYFNGYGKTRFVMTQGLVGALVFRIPLAFFFSSLPHANLFYLGMATPSASIFQIVICVSYFIYFQKKLVKK